MICTVYIKEPYYGKQILRWPQRLPPLNIHVLVWSDPIEGGLLRDDLILTNKAKVMQ